MYKLYLPMALLMSLILGSGLAAFTCRTGPFEGFFVSSVEFCNVKHNNFDDRIVLINNLINLALTKL